MENQEYLSDYKIETKPVSLQLRGLINKGNYCYVNSILQALLACPQVYHLLKGMQVLNNTTNYYWDNMSAIHGLSQFVSEFTEYTDNNNDFSNFGKPFEPTYVYKILRGKSESFQIEGRQEDAEEFLSSLLNTLNNEMMDMMNENKKPSLSKTSKSRISPVTKIFSGLLKSRIEKHGDKTTETVGGFITLPLDIENVNTVDQALSGFSNRNTLDGVTSSKTKKVAEAWEQTTMEQLPEVLVIHFKRFQYTIDGLIKIMKPVEYRLDLEINNRALSPKIRSKKINRKYKLFAVVYHQGNAAIRGHYFTDAYHQGYNTWLRYDDTRISSINVEDVLKPQGNQVPYLLFYRRCTNNGRSKAPRSL